MNRLFLPTGSAGLEGSEQRFGASLAHAYPQVDHVPLHPGFVLQGHSTYIFPARIVSPPIAKKFPVDGFVHTPHITVLLFVAEGEVRLEVLFNFEWVTGC